MQAAATPSPSDRLVFANQLAEVRALDATGQYKEQLDELEVEYQFTLLRSLDLFHKEMRRANLPERLQEIKEQLCGTAGEFTYQNNLPFTSWNWNIMICRHCKTSSAARTVGSSNPWMALPLITTKSISVAITGLSNKDAPHGGTTSGTTWKSMLRFSQTTDMPCLMRQLYRPMSSSRALQNSCPSGSRCRLWLTRSWGRLCRRQKRSTF